ncbi:MAG: ribonuclease E inhibitor RraB [Gemmatimonadetes bacterium]|nr:ribonuclease E inhibitor RraB [Gemmatimonadota bacterium]
MSKTPADPDSLVIEQLRAAGADLDQATEVVVYLYFPSKDAAVAAAQQVREMGFPGMRVSASADDSWACIGSRQMVPELGTIRELSRGLERLANALGGEYDGWEAAVRQ